MKVDRTFFSKALLMLALVLAGTAFGQIPMSLGTYSQNFDSLANSGTGIAWTNNLTLPGWYASKSTTPHDVTTYNAGIGSSTAGALYSFGGSGSAERALGSLGSGGPGDLAYGIRFTNDTGFAQTNFLVSYTGENFFLDCLAGFGFHQPEHQCDTDLERKCRDQPCGVYQCGAGRGHGRCWPGIVFALV